MIEELEWRRVVGEKEFHLWAYDGHRWFAIPYIEYPSYEDMKEGDNVT